MALLQRTPLRLTVTGRMMQQVIDVAILAQDHKRTMTSISTSDCMMLIEFFADALLDFQGIYKTEGKKWWKCKDKCELMVVSKIIEWGNGEDRYYDDAAIKKHAQLYALMTTDKEGNPNEYKFLMWCRMVVSIREQCGFATEHAAERCIRCR